MAIDESNTSWLYMYTPQSLIIFTAYENNFGTKLVSFKQNRINNEKQNLNTTDVQLQNEIEINGFDLK